MTSITLTPGGGRPITYTQKWIYTEHPRFFDSQAPQAKIFQKMIKINDFFIKMVFTWVYLTYFLSKNLHNHKKMLKMKKNLKIVEIFFSKILRFFFVIFR